MENKIVKIFNKSFKKYECNTSYPVFIDLFQKFRSLKNTSNYFKDITKISFYIHIPFCSKLCSFCEYTKFKYEYKNADIYLTYLEKEVLNFVNNCKSIDYLYGFDIGGGTPTVLSLNQLERLLKIQKLLEDNYKKSCDYEKSIEFSFDTLDEEKISLLNKYGFNRVSSGIQIYSNKFNSLYNRCNPTINKIININNLLKKYNINKLNIDIMYGLNNIKRKDLIETINAIKIIKPEQVTLYETRYNQINLKPKSSKDELYEDYCYLYDELLNIGYKSSFGSNTFSLENDFGVSSYIKHRMDEFIPYKGFGISSQSMSYNMIAYGPYKGNKGSYPDLNDDKEILYILPYEEIIAKYVSIAMYSGRINLNSFKKIIEINNGDVNKYNDIINWLINNNYMFINNNYLQVTKLGFKYYGSICSLFWSDEQKNKLLETEC